MLYDPEMVRPMREELTQQGFEDLTTPDSVDAFLSDGATQFLVINSVCGCAAGGARPGALLAVQKATSRPERCGTVFAGVDKEATSHARGKFADFPPSSPSIVLFKDGKPVHFVPRHMIEGRDPESLAADLIDAFEKNC